MSFRCQICGQPQPPGTKPVKVRTKVRKIVTGVKVSEDGKKGSTEERTDIVEEKLACSSCAKNAGPPKVEWR